MAAREFVAQLERLVPAPASRVWALMADSNRFERAAGLTPAKYEFRELTAGDPASRSRVAVSQQYGVDLSWVELPCEWIESRLLTTCRMFLQGPLSRAAIAVHVKPEPNGTRLVASVAVVGRGALGSIAGVFMRARLNRALRRYADSIDQVVSRADDTDTLYRADEPPGSQARASLMLGPPDAITSGEVSPSNLAEFEFRSSRFGGAPVDATLRARLLAHLRSRPDEELSQMRPFEIARAWNVDRRELLRAFLHAARAGLVDLNWQLNCPTCRVASEVASSLSSVRRTAHCDACNIDYDLDFSEHVEAVFKISNAIREVEPALYCASSPWFLPHVFAQLSVAPNGSRTVRAPIPRATLLLRTLSGKRRCQIDLSQGLPETLHVTVGGTPLTAKLEGPQTDAMECELHIENTTDTEVFVLVERSGWSADVVLGSAIITLPDFVDLFSAQAPAAGSELRVGSLTVLFSDLTGSTAMYERLGDARAFAVVQEHFRLMREAITQHGGAVIKTMGDAVMANFNSPVNAFLAALDMVKKTNDAHAELGLSVKIGLHEGPCLAIRANEQFDLFGTTVNVAARLQAQAHSSEVVIMQALLEHADVQRLVREMGLPERRFEAHLKGIREEQRLLGLDATAPARGRPALSPPAA